ncbi:MAG: SGNH/GDSL hydrolase family protein, partial [Propionibacteriaceae bacterium]|nr:SGNH/GDSL hydrolase family protein [Propionibacteriaceae bacterium]
MAVKETKNWTKYVAIGDSLTEGIADFDNEGNPRGWADRLAQHLANHCGQSVQYANLAVRGRLLKPILDEQVGPALALKPDLVSIWGGGNDMLRPDSDVDKMADQLEAAVKVFRAANVDLILALGIDAKDSPIINLTRKRTAVLNAH